MLRLVKSEESRVLARKARAFYSIASFVWVSIVGCWGFLLLARWLFGAQ